MRSLTEAAKAVEEFGSGSLTERISALEAFLPGMDKTSCETALTSFTVNPALLESAFTLKKAAGQINTLIHAVGI